MGDSLWGPGMSSVASPQTKTSRGPPRSGAWGRRGEGREVGWGMEQLLCRHPARWPCRVTERTNSRRSLTGQNGWTGSGPRVASAVRARGPRCTGWPRPRQTWPAARPRPGERKAMNFPRAGAGVEAGGWGGGGTAIPAVSRDLHCPGPVPPPSPWNPALNPLDNLGTKSRRRPMMSRSTASPHQSQDPHPDLPLLSYPFPQAPPLDFRLGALCSPRCLCGSS